MASGRERNTMKPITAQDFARLCREDPDLHDQMLAIPKTVSAEKIFALAECNGYRILPVQHPADPLQMEPLDDAALDRVTGGTGAMTEEEKWDAFHVWMYYIMGFGDAKQDR